MTLRVPRRLAASLALLCVLAGCKHAQERSVPLSEVVKASQASRGMRIQTAGVATYSDPEWRVLFVQDQAVGMFLWAPPNSKIAAGDKLQIVGNITSQGELEQSSFHIVSRNNPLPAPVSLHDFIANRPGKVRRGSCGQLVPGTPDEDEPSVHENDSSQDRRDHGGPGEVGSTVAQPRLRIPAPEDDRNGQREAQPELPGMADRQIDGERRQQDGTQNPYRVDEEEFPPVGGSFQRFSPQANG